MRRNLKSKNGITLISIIITLLIMLILASVAIIFFIPQDGFWWKLTRSIEIHDKEKIREEINLKIFFAEGKNLYDYLSNQQEFDSVFRNNNIISVEIDGYIADIDENTKQIIRLEKEDNRQIYVSAIKLDRNEINLEIETSDTLFATVEPENASSKEVEWFSSDNNIVSVDQSGNIMAKNAGEATIIVKAKDGSGKEDTCIVKVTGKPTVAITSTTQVKGDYLQYPVKYIDASDTSFEFSDINGWRILSYTLDESDENNKTIDNLEIISTGIPVKLDWYGESNTNNDWWDKDKESLTDFYENVLGGSEFGTYSLTDSSYRGIRAASGMYKYFKDIKLKYAASTRGDNLFFYKSITVADGATYNSTNNQEKTGEELFLTGRATNVRTLTLPEVNLANGKEIDFVSTTGNTSTYLQDETGIYRLENLEVRDVNGEIQKPYTTTDKGSYFLASPYPSNYKTRLTYIDYDGRISYGNNYVKGVRVVVSLGSDIQLIEETAENGDTYYVIKE